ncbi:MAG: toxin-antitoxin system YwqK family antitoxin [Opitutae bacterium]|nr:toxin-antitoxin system YwqK family antitoxin [Opitutae bacterium]
MKSKKYLSHRGLFSVLVTIPTLFILAACSSGELKDTNLDKDVVDSFDWSGSSGQFAEKFVMRNGKLHTLSDYSGTIIILDDEARNVSRENYRDGVRTGVSTRWWENGQKKMEATYVDGKPSGPTFEWFLSGKKKLEKEYSNGIPHGKEVAWYDDGEMHYERHYSGGKPHGVWTDWARGGTIARQIQYENGKAIKQIAP